MKKQPAARKRLFLWLIRTKPRLKRMYELIVKIKTESRCVDCHKHFPSYCMEFDHVRGKKKFNIGEAVTLQVTMQELKRELAKCQVRCSCCHKIVTYQRRRAKQAVQYNKMRKR